MYTKLFERITQSSLMEETIEVRYAFMMLLAISNSDGLVVGTDIALARRVNMPLNKFLEAIARLTAPDPESNSKAQEGRRLIVNDGERGYLIVNYIKYRNIKDSHARDEYMRNYQRTYREQGRDKSRPVKPVNNGKLGLTQADTDTDAKADEKPIQSAPPPVFSPLSDAMGREAADGVYETLKTIFGEVFGRGYATNKPTGELKQLAALLKSAHPERVVNVARAAWQKYSLYPGSFYLGKSLSVNGLCAHFLEIEGEASSKKSPSVSDLKTRKAALNDLIKRLGNEKSKLAENPNSEDFRRIKREKLTAESELRECENEIIRITKITIPTT